MMADDRFDEKFLGKWTKVEERKCEMMRKFDDDHDDKQRWRLNCDMVIMIMTIKKWTMKIKWVIVSRLMEMMTCVFSLPVFACSLERQMKIEMK